MHVLLIEPNYSLGKTYQQALKQAGQAVSWQRSAQAAIAAADKRTPDAVVLELQLPGHSGVEFLYEFRSYTDWQAIPVVVHTFIPEERFALHRRQFKTLGISTYLYKPRTTLPQFLQSLHELPAAII